MQIFEDFKNCPSPTVTEVEIRESVGTNQRWECWYPNVNGGKEGNWYDFGRIRYLVKDQAINDQPGIASVPVTNTGRWRSMKR